MVVIDSHLDLAWNAVNWNRDLSLSVAAIRGAEAAMKEERRGHNTVTFPEMRKGEVAACLATLLARSTGRARKSPRQWRAGSSVITVSRSVPGGCACLRIGQP